MKARGMDGSEEGGGLSGEGEEEGGGLSGEGEEEGGGLSGEGEEEGGGLSGEGEEGRGVLTDRDRDWNRDRGRDTLRVGIMAGVDGRGWGGYGHKIRSEEEKLKCKSTQNFDIILSLLRRITRCWSSRKL